MAAGKVSHTGDGYHEEGKQGGENGRCKKVTRRESPTGKVKGQKNWGGKGVEDVLGEGCDEGETGLTENGSRHYCLRLQKRSKSVGKVEKRSAGVRGAIHKGRRGLTFEGKSPKNPL